MFLQRVFRTGDASEPSSPAGQRLPTSPSARQPGRPPVSPRVVAGVAPLSLPADGELFVETGPPTDSHHSLGLGSPQSAREIRARPIDIDKEIPLMFVDDDAGNCRDVSRAVPGCTVVHVSRAAGMRADEGGAVREFGAVREWLARPPAAALGGKGTVAQKEDGAVDEFALSGMV